MVAASSSPFSWCRDAIANAHDSITQDLDTAGANLSDRLAEAGQRIAASLGAWSDDIAHALDRTSSATLERIVQKAHG